MKKLFLPTLCLPVLGLLGPAAQANEIRLFRTVFATDLATSGVGGLRDVGIGTIALSGVTGPVTEAYLYWHGPENRDPSEPGNADVFFNDIAVTGTPIGASASNCWPYRLSHAYRADVTPLVDGDGSYSLTGFGAGDVNTNGASLIVFFDDGDSLNDRDVVIFDGNDSNIINDYDSRGWNLTLRSIEYTFGPAFMQMHVSDGQGFEDASMFINGQLLAQQGDIFTGFTVPGANDGPSGSGRLWDIVTFDVTSYLVPGPNMLNLRSDVDRDCLSLIAALIDLPGGSAPEQPLPDTGPQCLVDLGDTIPGEDGFLDVIVNANEPFSFIATGVDDDPADVLTLTSSGVPSGASLTPGDGAMGPSPLATVFDWTPTDDDAASLHVVEVTFTDSEGESSSCSIEITVNRGPVCVVAGAPAITFQCTSPDGAFVTLDGSGSSDPDGDDLTFAWAISNDSVSSSSTDQAVLEGLFPVGVTMATLSVADGRGAVASCDVLVTVEGLTAPGVLCTTSTAMLWPPKGQLVDVEIYILATDECADPDVVFPIIVTVSSNEPDASQKGSGDVNGQDGYSSPVAVNAVWTGNPGEFTATIQLRAERDGDGDGRKYTIDVIASDGTFSEATTSCCIVVPHSMRGAK